MNAYRIADISDEYAVAIHYNEKYYRCINITYEPENLMDVIDLMGVEENIDVAYVEVVLYADSAVEYRYIYEKDIDKWVWQLLRNGEHRAVENAIVHHNHSISDDTIMKYADVNIKIINQDANVEYDIKFGLETDMLVFCDSKYSLYDFGFEFTKEELTEALSVLARDYEAYKQ